MRDVRSAESIIHKGALNSSVSKEQKKIDLQEKVDLAASTGFEPVLPT